MAGIVQRGLKVMVGGGIRILSWLKLERDLSSLCLCLCLCSLCLCVCGVSVCV
jgi:hypothetical protein